MSQTKYLLGECQHCGQPIRYPAESIGSATDCPHCGHPTDLLLATPRSERVVPTKTIVYTTVAVIILIGGLVGAIIAVNRLQRTIQQRTAIPPEAVAPGVPAAKGGDFRTPGGFWASAVTLEEAQGRSQRYAVGTIRNETDHSRLAVEVVLELSDASGRRLGAVMDQLAVLAPKAEWRFKTLITFPGVARARVVSIKAEE